MGEEIVEEDDNTFVCSFWAPNELSLLNEGQF
jgi:hypothetical protein